MLNLKLQYFGYLMQRTNSLEKTLMLGKIEGRRRRGRHRMRWLDGIADLVDEFEQASGVGEGQGNLACCSPWGHKESDTTEVAAHILWNMGYAGIFPSGSIAKETTCNAGDLGSTPGSRRFSGEGNGNLLQYSCLENPMDRGTWQVTFHGVTKNQIQLSGFTFTFFPSAFALLAIYC